MRNKEKIMAFVKETYKNPADIVNLEDICAHLKRNYGEFERKPEKEIMKMVEWQAHQIVQEVTGTNI